jgi:GNAT superfamily N-acetyltransferase
VANAGDVTEALDAERRLVLTLGGLALEIAGATLVTHEKLPVPRFNYVQVGEVARERQAAFFERALDHYFQRALRPTFRIRPPVPPHLDEGLRRFGFRARSSPLVLLRSTGGVGRAAASRFEVRAAEPGELDLVVSFWTSERERPEFRSALDVAWNHPHPGEELSPVLAFEGGRAVAAALVYRHGEAAGIHAVATQPDSRGRGAASALVEGAVAGGLVHRPAHYWIFADSARLKFRLERLGFAPADAFQEYELPSDAALALPAVGPPGPPRWRPPRHPA